MKKSLILLVLLISCMNLLAQSTDSVKIAVLKVDVFTNQFEGGYFSKHYCPNCPSDSIPFVISSTNYGDFGQIVFKLSPSMDTVFYGDLNWMSVGQIHHPDTFYQDSPYTDINSKVSLPGNIRYILPSPGISVDMADSAWLEIDSLEITKNFAEDNFKTTIYYYNPSAGSIGANAFKWIIFLYQKLSTSKIDNSKKHSVNIYPNPARDIIKIKSPNKQIIKQIAISDITSRLLKSIKPASSFYSLNTSNLSNGIYLITVKSNGISVTEKIFIKK